MDNFTDNLNNQPNDADNAVPKPVNQTNFKNNNGLNNYTLEEKDQIKMLEVLHLAGNLFSGGVLSSLLIAVFLLARKDISANVKTVAYDIINFNLSFMIYMGISLVLIVVLVGFLGLIIFGIAWFVIMILGAVKHFAGERYDYPMTIKFLK